MKIRFCGVWLLFLCSGACSVPDTFRLEGNLQGLSEGTVITLIPTAIHRQEKPIGETLVKDGKFVFEGKLPEPRLCVLEAGGKLIYYPFMLENGKVVLSGKVTSQVNGNQTTLPYEDMKVEGCKADQEFRTKTAYREKLNELHRQLQEKYKEISGEISEARRTGNAVMIDSLNQCEEMKAFGKDETAFFTQVEEQIKAVITANKDSYWGPLLMLHSFNYFTGDPDQLALFNSFPEEVQKGYYGQVLRKELMPESVVNKKLPAFSAPDTDGNMHSDTELREGKKCVIIDFWASWCGPCRKEIPNLKKIYEDYASKGLEIISISIDKDDKAWQKALEEEQLPWPNLIDREDMFGDRFYGRTIPAIFLVGEDGVVKYDKLRGEALAQKVAELLN